MITLLQLAIVVASFVILSESIKALNRMTKNTNHTIRVSFILMSAGSFSEIASVIYGRIPGIAESLLVIGYGLLDFIDRRATLRCPYVADERPEKCR